MSWITESYMGKKAVARGKAGRTHSLNKAVQGEYHYVYGPYARPVLTIDPGDIIVAETEDAFGGVIKTVDDLPSQKLNMPFVNPQCGPVAVSGAEKGDVLCVHIHSIKPRGPQPVGTSALIPEFGGLVSNSSTALLNPPLPERVMKYEVTEDGVKFSDRVMLPYEPFMGTIGTAPQIDSVNSLTPGSHGGNMDLPGVGPGGTLYLPVRAKGALLYLGDGHAVQGDGEVCGVAIEFPTTTRMTLDLVKGWNLSWPRLEHDEYIMSIGSARPLEDAARIAYADLVQWMVNGYGFDRWEAYMLLTQIGKVRLGNMVDPNYTVGASIAKEYLA